MSWAFAAATGRPTRFLAICCHLEAHAHRVQRRNRNARRILSALHLQPPPGPKGLSHNVLSSFFPSFTSPLRGRSRSRAASPCMGASSLAMTAAAAQPLPPPHARRFSMPHADGDLVAGELEAEAVAEAAPYCASPLATRRSVSLPGSPAVGGGAAAAQDGWLQGAPHWLLPQNRLQELTPVSEGAEGGVGERLGNVSESERSDGGSSASSPPPPAPTLRTSDQELAAHEALQRAADDDMFSPLLSVRSLAPKPPFAFGGGGGEAPTPRLPDCDSVRRPAFGVPVGEGAPGSLSGASDCSSMHAGDLTAQDSLQTAGSDEAARAYVAALARQVSLAAAAAARPPAESPPPLEPPPGPLPPPARVCDSANLALPTARPPTPPHDVADQPLAVAPQRGRPPVVITSVSTNAWPPRGGSRATTTLGDSDSTIATSAAAAAAAAAAQARAPPLVISSAPMEAAQAEAEAAAAAAAAALRQPPPLVMSSAAAENAALRGKGSVAAAAAAVEVVDISSVCCPSWPVRAFTSVLPALPCFGTNRSCNVHSTAVLWARRVHAHQGAAVACTR